MTFYCNCFTALDEPINAARAYTPYQTMTEDNMNQ